MNTVTLRVKCMGGHMLPGDDHQEFVSEKYYNTSYAGVGSKQHAISKAFREVAQMIASQAFYGNNHLRAPYEAYLYYEGTEVDVLKKVYRILALDEAAIHLAPKPCCPTCGK